jgi:hypothetical protein
VYTDNQVQTFYANVDYFCNQTKVASMRCITKTPLSTSRNNEDETLVFLPQSSCKEADFLTRDIEDSKLRGRVVGGNVVTLAAQLFDAPQVLLMATTDHLATVKLI